MNNEEIDECSDSDDDSDDELVEEDPGIGMTATANDDAPTVAATANDDVPTVAAANSNNELKKDKSVITEKPTRIYLHPWGITDLWLRTHTRLVVDAY